MRSIAKQTRSLKTGSVEVRGFGSKLFIMNASLDVDALIDNENIFR